MARTKKHTHWRPNSYERILFGITLAIALTFLVIVLTPIVASLSLERVPKEVPLLRSFPMHQ